MPNVSVRLFVGLFVICAAGCQRSEATPAPLACFTETQVRDSFQWRIDLLFVLDNTASDEVARVDLARQFPLLIQGFQRLADQGTFVDLHIGVITTDFGAGASGAPGCGPSPGGQQGRLQAIGQHAAPGCQKPLRANYIQYGFFPGGNGGNLPDGQDLAQTFTCMSSVGSSGCGFRHPLEAARAALHDNLADNQGFLREEALLVVLFLTSGDDCSAPPDTDVFDRSKSDQYGYLSGYRCQRYGVVCGDPPSPPPYGGSMGPLSSCAPAPNPNNAGPGKLYDVSRYIDMFTRVPSQGGLKANPDDVLLVGIDGPEQPFKVSLGNPGAPGPHISECAMVDVQSNPPCVPILENACTNPDDDNYAARPAVRLNAVLHAIPRSSITSYCAKDYGAVLQTASREMAARAHGGCLFDRVATTPDNVDCDVEDSPSPRDLAPMPRIPRCDGSATRPCYRVVPEDACVGVSPDGLGVVVERAAPHSVGAITRVRCQSDCAR